MKRIAYLLISLMVMTGLAAPVQAVEPSSSNVAVMAAQFKSGERVKVGKSPPGTAKVPKKVRDGLKISRKLSANGVTFWLFTTGGISEKQAKMVCRKMYRAGVLQDRKMCDVFLTVDVVRDET